MADDPVPRGLTAEVARDWAALGRPAPAGPPFRAADVGGLPEPVRRWLLHAVADGTPAVRGAELRTHGEIRIGRWTPFTAVQRLSVADGFVWAATARPFGLPILGFDRWTRGTGEMRWRLFDVVPVLSSRGEDVSRSAAGRLAGELLILLPTAALGPEVHWRSHDGHSAVAVVRMAEVEHEVTLTVGPDGALTELVMSRWGPLGHGSFGAQPFGVTLHGELSAGGITVPRRITAGWHYGTDRWPEGQFIRSTVDDVRWL